MLVSYKYKFIFFKTIKTASSSVFTFFTPYCLPSNHEFKYENELNDNHLGFWKTGIVGNALSIRNETKRHVPCYKAKNILNKIDKKIWNNYFKFCVVRNPWDLCVSYFFYRKRDGINRDNSFEEMIEKLDDGINKINTRQDLYKLNGKYVCNFYIKFENLKNGLIKVCDICNIKDYDLNNLTNNKSNYRDRSIHYSNFYNNKTKDKVASLYADDIKKFDYEFEKNYL